MNLRPIRNGQHARQRIRRIRRRLMYLTGKSGISNRAIWILAEPRSGSNWLRDLLSSQPNVKLAGEILNPWAVDGLWVRKRNLSEVTNHIRDAVASRAEWCGAKLMLHHLRYHNISLNDIASIMGDNRWIVLYRRDLLAQYVSAEQLMKTGVHLTHDSGSSCMRLTIDLERFEDYCTGMQQSFTDICAQLANNNMSFMIISYEQLKGFLSETLEQQLVPWLELSHIQMNSQLKKQEMRRLDQIVVNFDDVIARVPAHLRTLDLHLTPGLNVPT